MWKLQIALLELTHGAQGPNPWKVVIILEELKLPYELEYVDFSQIKKEPFISVNPNGRVPAIEDPNTGITLWEVRYTFQADTSRDHWGS